MTRQEMIRAKRSEARRLRAEAEMLKARARRVSARADDFTFDTDAMADRLQAMARSRISEANISTRTAKKLKRFEAVPNAPFRERFESLVRRDLIDASGVARRAGLTRRSRGSDGQLRDAPDATYALRLLGLRPWPTGGKGQRLATIASTVSYDTGVRLADALQLPYTEAGV